MRCVSSRPTQDIRPRPTGQPGASRPAQSTPPHTVPCIVKTSMPGTVSTLMARESWPCRHLIPYGSDPLVPGHLLDEELGRRAEQVAHLAPDQARSKVSGLVEHRDDADLISERMAAHLRLSDSTRACRGLHVREQGGYVAGRELANLPKGSPLRPLFRERRPVPVINCCSGRKMSSLAPWPRMLVRKKR